MAQACEIKTRAIYIPDINYKEMPIFELKDNYFVNIDDESFRYDVDTVLSDKNWIVVSCHPGGRRVENVR